VASTTSVGTVVSASLGADASRTCAVREARGGLSTTRANVAHARGRFGSSAAGSLSAANPPRLGHRRGRIGAPCEACAHGDSPRRPIWGGSDTVAEAFDAFNASMGRAYRPSVPAGIPPRGRVVGPAMAVLGTRRGLVLRPPFRPRCRPRFRPPIETRVDPMPC